ncbi:helix-turn-helix transcriptional regulator [Chitinibacter sp. SCUT-21]|uniref:helix-turn-helix transcriptional regulator n=1 Tax=Chitinibacter sp. SCUT-21 TaxID=2970891 RepID=UPI0035A61529
MSLVHGKVIQYSVIRAAATQQLREVTLLQPTLMRIRHGEKHLWMHEQQQIAGKSDILIGPAGMQLTLSNVPDAQGYYCEILQFHPHLIERFRHDYGAILQNIAQQAPQFIATITPVIAQTWDETLAALTREEPAAMLEHRALGLLLAIALAGYGSALLSIRSDSLAERVQQLMMLHPARNWSVDEVAKQLHLGASTLRRQLDQEGSSFRSILDQVRLNLALGLIQTSKLAIGDIAQQCGYASASRFSARFQQQFGLKPLQLRATVA